jgi:hypothetical protein
MALCIKFIWTISQLNSIISGSELVFLWIIMQHQFIKVLVALNCLFISSLAMANLIQNGGFEDTAVNNNSWAWFHSSDVDGWQGSNVEIWHNYGNFASYQGSQHAELNAHPSDGNAFVLFQSFATVIGNTYDLSFVYAARSNTDEAFSVNVQSGSNSPLVNNVIDDHIVRVWSAFNVQFEATDLLTTLTFTSITPYSGTVGNFIDSVQVVASTLPPPQLPEPAGLFLAGFAVIALMRQRLICSAKK